MALSRRVLVVAGESQRLESMGALLQSMGYRHEKASDGVEALVKMQLDVDLVLMEARLPDMDGFEWVERIQSDVDYREVPILMVCGVSERQACKRAIKAGAADFLTRPVDEMELGVRIASLLKMKQLSDTYRENRLKMEEIVDKRTADLRKALQDMAIARRSVQEAHIETIRRLSIAAEYKDDDTAAHIHRMSRYAALIAQGLNLPQSEVEIITHASLMHDVGKIGIPDHILFKPDRLDSGEWIIMKEHTTIGSRILDDSTSRVMQAGRLIAVSHHEKWDGSGYPNGLKGDSIPLWGRICCVADVFDALTSDRPYKNAFTIENAVEIMAKDRGSHFDPTIIDTFLGQMDLIRQVQQENGARAMAAAS